MYPPSSRDILHLDIDAFFASVEQRDDPRLRGRPVAVGTGVVASCSYEARLYGVRTAMRLAEARQLCRPLIVLPGEYLRYEQVGRQVLSICRERTPLVEAAALDDLYLDVSRLEPERVADTVYEQVRDEIRVAVSIGGGANKLVAAVATKQVKSEKLRVKSEGKAVTLHFSRVPPGTEQSFLAPWPVRVLPGAGSKLQVRLDRLNIQRVGQVAEMPPLILEQLFGGGTGKRLHEYSHGVDHRPVTPDRRPQSVSRSTSFDPPVADPAFLRAMLDYLLERAASQLRLRDLAARGLTVRLRYGDYQSADGREWLARPTQRDDLLREAAHDRFARLYTRRLPLRLLGVELAPLAPVKQQADLFTGMETLADDRHQRLNACKDAIRQRFGFTSLLSAGALTLTNAIAHDRENLRLRTPCLTR